MLGLKLGFNRVKFLNQMEKSEGAKHDRKGMHIHAFLVGVHTKIANFSEHWYKVLTFIKWCYIVN